MKTCERKAVPLWMLRYEQARERIRDATKDHPLKDLETDMLAEYLEQVLNNLRDARCPGKPGQEYRTIIDWLQVTSRISPKEHGDLAKISDEMMKRTT